MGNSYMKEVNIKLPSEALGDNLAWMPYIEEYRRRKRVKVNAIVARYDLFEETYPKINFLKPGTKLYNHVMLHPDFQCGIDLSVAQTKPLQQCANDMLGLRNFKEIKPKLLVPDEPSRVVGKYVTISTQASKQCKYWNNLTGWDEVIEWLKGEGYNVLCIDKWRHYGDEKTNFINPIPNGVIDKTGGIQDKEEHFDLYDRMVDIKHADFHIGLPSGLSWLSWSVGTHVVMISGFSDSNSEFQTGITRVEPIEKDICKFCWNREPFINYDWWWCPDHKGTPRQFECSLSITGEQVIDAIKKHIGNK
jgi:autotransporter strand-loop-strand O-heptosyltransferase